MSSAAATDLTQVVTFRIADDLFAADVFSVERVLRWQTPTAIPDVPQWIEGVIDYQGRVVPVINLRRRFELPALEVRNETRILVFTAAGEWIGAVVDAVVEVSTLDMATVSPPPPLFRGLAGEYLRGIVKRNDRLVILLDVPRLLTTTERLALDQQAAAAAERADA